jgi:hypothetical protein
VVSVVRMTRRGPVHQGPSKESQRSLRRTRSPGLIEIVMGPFEGWGRIWSACSLEKFPEKIKVRQIAREAECVGGKFFKRNGWPYII